jgi:hypothetical protein
LEIADRYVDGSTQVNCNTVFTFGLPIEQPDNLGTHSSSPESPGKDADGHLISRYRVRTSANPVGLNLMTPAGRRTSNISNQSRYSTCPTILLTLGKHANDINDSG